MPTFTVKAQGLEELERKLDYKVLVDPAMDEARDKIVARLVRPSKGLGSRMNTVTPRLVETGAVLTTTLAPPQARGGLLSRLFGGNRVVRRGANPRTTGRTWQRNLIGIGRKMGPNVLRKTVQRIEARWAQGG